MLFDVYIMIFQWREHLINNYEKMGPSLLFMWVVLHHRLYHDQFVDHGELHVPAVWRTNAHTHVGKCFLTTLTLQMISGLIDSETDLEGFAIGKIPHKRKGEASYRKTAQLAVIFPATTVVFPPRRPNWPHKRDLPCLVLRTVADAPL